MRVRLTDNRKVDVEITTSQSSRLANTGHVFLYHCQPHHHGKVQGLKWDVCAKRPVLPLENKIFYKAFNTLCPKLYGAIRPALVFIIKTTFGD